MIIALAYNLHYYAAQQSILRYLLPFFVFSSLLLKIVLPIFLLTLYSFQGAFPQLTFEPVKFQPWITYYTQLPLSRQPVNFTSTFAEVCIMLSHDA